MSRFTLTTLLAIAALTVTSFTLPAPARDWAVLIVWTIYIAICGLGMISITLQFYCPAICRGPAGKMRVALTFDDGPDPNSTPKLLDLLNREKIPATFFCIGKKIDAHPQIAARIVTEGHLLENHTFSHHWWTCCTWGKKLEAEITRAQEAIKTATAITPHYMRSPAGLTNPFFAKILNQLDLTLIGWDVRTYDTIGSAQAAINRITKNTRDGSILLLHDGRSSPERIEQIVTAAIKNLRSNGFEFERLDRLIKPPETDRTKSPT